MLRQIASYFKAISLFVILASLCLVNPLAKAEDKKNIPVIPLSQLLDLEKNMKEGKLKGVKYFDPKKDMKKAEGYYLLLRGQEPIPIGKKGLEKLLMNLLKRIIIT